jgi:hypothetical protein
MINFDLSSWTFWVSAFALMFGVLILQKIFYSAKSFVPLPDRKPLVCLLPKYFLALPLNIAKATQDELESRLAMYGFRVNSADDNSVRFTRGSVLGDFSIKITKVNVIAALPLTDPVQLKVEYGVIFGCAFDTGDLWKFCRELTQQVEANARRVATADYIETGNPYQSPPR